MIDQLLRNLGLDEINDAFTLMKEGKSIRTIHYDK